MTTQDDSSIAKHGLEAQPGEPTITAHAHNPEERVAIIAIHGVGQHLSGASADAVSTLLLSMGRDKDSVANPAVNEPPIGAPYSGFNAISVDVPLRRVEVPQADAETANDRSLDSLWSRFWGIFNERRGFLAEVRQRDISGLQAMNLARKAENLAPDRGRDGYKFMVTQLAAYEGEVDRNFQTVRLEGQRTGDKPASVHI